MEEREENIEQLLSHNVEEVIEKEHLRAALHAGKKLRVKLGIDPTSPDLHLGHAVILRKLREFQDLGCVAVLVVGDFTGRIGDPSGRAEARKPLSSTEVKQNMKNYLAQAGKVLDIKKAEIVYNSAWFEKEGIEELVRLASAATFQQVLRRADFKKRIYADQDITFLELLYPLFQGYDSVKIKADVELGGTDQTFNVLMGRRVERHFGLPEQDIMTLSLLEGLDGVKKMSKSLGNYIGLADEPEDMFGKIMSLPDVLMEKYFQLCTDLPDEEIKKLREDLKPKQLKERLGIEIVKLYYGGKAAQKANEAFNTIFSKKDLSAVDLPAVKISGEVNLVELVVLCFAAVKTRKSKTEARRLIMQKSVKIDGKVWDDPTAPVGSGTDVVQIGRFHFRIFSR